MGNSSLSDILAQVKERISGKDIISRYSPDTDISTCLFGDDYKIKCFLPGHNDDTPSLSISKSKFVYKCFANCSGENSKGDFITLIRTMENCDFKDAVGVAASMVGVVTPKSYTPKVSLKRPSSKKAKPIYLKVEKKEKPEIEEKTISDFISGLEKNFTALKYLKNERHLSISMIEKYHIGCDKRGNITIPIYDDGKIINIRYRNKDVNPKKGFPKYWSHSVTIKGKKKEEDVKISFGDAALFNKDLLLMDSDAIVILCAGEFDAMLSTSKKHRTIGICSTGGEGTWDKEWDNLLLDRTVIICYDNDKAGRDGSKLVLDHIPNATIANLAGKVGAKGDVSDLVGQLGLTDAIDHILEFGTLANSNEEDIGGDLLPSPVKTFNPAFHITGSGKVYITAMFKVIKTAIVGSKKDTREVTYEAIEPVIVSSDRSAYSIPEVDDEISKLDNNAVATFKGMTCTQTPSNAQTKWSGSRVKRFLSGHKSHSNVTESYMDIFKTVNSYAKLSRKTYTGLISLYILGSYFYEIFPSYPYLHLHGVKGSGKSTLARVISGMSFNAIFMINPTLAVLARTIEEQKGLVVIDEMEQNSTRKDGRSPISQIMNSGYQKGASRPICDTENNNKIVKFDLYCPKVICNINDLNDVTKSRCISIVTKRIEGVVIKKDAEADPNLLYISRGLYEVLMTRTPDAIAAYNEVKAMNEFAPLEKNIGALKVFGRTRELFIPLLSMARFIYNESGFTKPWDNIIKELQFIDEEKDLDENETPEETLKTVLIEMLKKTGMEGMHVTCHEILEEYKLLFISSKSGLEGWITKRLRNFGLSNVKKYPPSRKRFRCHVMRDDGNIDTIEKRLTVYTVTWDTVGMDKPLAGKPGETRIQTMYSERKHISVISNHTGPVQVIENDKNISNLKPKIQDDDIPF